MDMAVSATRKANLRRSRQARTGAITDKLDEIVNDQWREPDDYLAPLTGAPHSKLRIGQFRLGADCDHDETILDIYTIERRGSAYKPGDD